MEVMRCWWLVKPPSVPTLVAVRRALVQGRALAAVHQRTTPPFAAFVTCARRGESVLCRGMHEMIRLRLSEQNLLSRIPAARDLHLWAPAPGGLMSGQP